MAAAAHHKPAPPVTARAGLLRRLAALCYDLLLVGAIWMAVTLGIVVVRGGEPVPPGSVAYQLFLAAAACLFFVGSWVRGGQTPGMRAWRLKLAGSAGEPVKPRQAAVRFMASVATGGLGLLWLWFDTDGLTLHDRIAGTRMSVVPAPAG